jgi:lysine-ketoglutarate reductase/saccharopine dehydrogenase-like protein (TIGR00300 family)
MTARETVELRGHIVDSLLLPKVLDAIVDAGADYRIVDFDMGRTATDHSLARIEITATDDASLELLLEELQVHGVNLESQTDAEVVVADTDGVLPVGFYSTTNLPTQVRVGGRWVDVERPEMDCAVVVSSEGGTAVARTTPMHRVARGDRIVVGFDGVRVTAPEKPRGVTPFEFMASEVSSEKPKALLVSRVVDRVRDAKAAGGKVLAVCGPAVIHTGAGPDVARLVRDGWVDVLFAGNGFATHDIESNVLGTSLGVSVHEGAPVEHGHANHLRVINEVRRRGSIAAAVGDGFVTGGVMYECVQRGVPFVLGGSVRDDGPLPDVHTDVVDAADAMRALLPGVAVALMLASTLHAIATGNLLPAGVETYCVDINQAVVTKLADRGSHQALGLVTDVGLFLRDLVDGLCGAD